MKVEESATEKSGHALRHPAYQGPQRQEPNGGLQNGQVDMSNAQNANKAGT